MTGGYYSLFRTADSHQSLLELLLKSLNEARGTAFEPIRGSIVWVENFALAKTLADAWEASRRFSLQFDPMKMSVYLERWEKILNLMPSPSDTKNSRRKAVAARFKTFTYPAYSQYVIDYIDETLGELFVNILHSTTLNARSTLPGGVTIPGGVTLSSDTWKSSIHYLAVRVVQPLSMTDSEFYDTSNKIYNLLDNYVPAYTTYDWGRFAPAVGTISVNNGTYTVTGTLTEFQTSPGDALVPGDEIEVWDDSRNLVRLIIDSVSSDTQLLVTVPPTVSITDKPYRRLGFFLDQENLDNSFLRQ